MTHPTEQPDPAPAAGGEPLAPGVRIAPGGSRFAFSRASGPGGQNVNKLSTRAELRVAVTDIIGLDPPAVGRLRQFAGKRLTRDDDIAIVCGEFRTQLANRQACFDRLRELVLKAMVIPKIRRKTKPSRGSKERRLESKRSASATKSMRRRPAHDD